MYRRVKYHKHDKRKNIEYDVKGLIHSMVNIFNIFDLLERTRVELREILVFCNV